MKRAAILRALWLLTGAASAGAAWADEGADILFKDLRGVMPAEITETIYRDSFASFLTPSADGSELLEEGGRSTSYEATVEDLNRDGVHEIFVVGGNTYLSGYAGA